MSLQVLTHIVTISTVVGLLIVAYQDIKYGKYSVPLLYVLIASNLIDLYFRVAVHSFVTQIVSGCVIGLIFALTLLGRSPDKLDTRLGFLFGISTIDYKQWLMYSVLLFTIFVLFSSFTQRTKRSFNLVVAPFFILGYIIARLV